MLFSLVCKYSVKLGGIVELRVKSFFIDFMILHVNMCNPQFESQIPKLYMMILLENH